MRNIAPILSLLLLCVSLSAQTTPILPESALAANAGDRYGAAVSVSGDRLVVGAPGVSLDAGAVFVFEYVDGAWSRTQTISAPAGALSFGAALELDGDRLVVGAESSTVQGTADAGAAFIYDFVGGTAALTQSLSQGTPVAGSMFGKSVSLDGDLIAVGAPGSQNVHVYELAGASWNEVAVVNPPPTGVHVDFGFSVAITEYSVGWLFVGSPGWKSSSGATWTQGRISCFRETSAWNVAVSEFSGQTGAFTGPGLGASVAVSGSANRWLAGAPNTDYAVYGSMTSSGVSLNGTGTSGSSGYVSGSGWGSRVAVSDSGLFMVAQGDTQTSTVSIHLNSLSFSSYLAVQSSPFAVGDNPLSWGASVAISDEHAIVGAPLTTGNATQSGSVRQLDPLHTFEWLEGGVPVDLDEVPTALSAVNSELKLRGWRAWDTGFEASFVGDRHSQRLINNGLNFVALGSGVWMRERRYERNEGFPPGPDDVDALPVDLELTLGSVPVVYENALTLQVSETVVGSGTFAALSQAVNSSPEGTRIRLPRFTSYTGVGTIALKRSQTLLGDLNDPSSVEIFGGSVVLADPGLSGGTQSISVGGFQIRNAQVGISVTSGRPWIRSVNLQGNSGPAISVSNDAHPRIWDVRVSANGGGGVVVSNAAMTLRDSLILENSGGPGISVSGGSSGLTSIFSSLISCNVNPAGRGGGVLLGAGARARVFGCTIDSNFAPQGGGGVALLSPADVEVSGNVILGNRNAAYGCLNGASSPLSSQGGGIYADTQSLLRIEANEIRDNRASVGGGIYIDDASNPRIARNWIACNAVEQAVNDGPADFFGPGVYLSGSTYAAACQADVLNNTIVGNVVLGSPSAAETERGFGIQGGLMGQGDPQIVNNIVSASSACGLPATAPQGWAVQLAGNQFTSIRSNSLFGGIESAQGVACIGAGNTQGNTVCTTCCPIAGVTSGNLYSDPQVDPGVVEEVASASPAFKTGLTAAPTLPPDFYSGFMLISRGYVERDGVLIGGSFVTPVVKASDPGSKASVSLSDPLQTVQFEVFIDVGLSVIQPTQFSEGVQVVTYGVDYAFNNAFGGATAGPNNALIELPIRVPLTDVREVALFQRNATTGKYDDTGIRSTSIDVGEGVVRFDGVSDFTEQLVGAVIVGEPGAFQQYSLNASSVNTISLEGAGSTKLGQTLQLVSSGMTGAPGFVVLAQGQANIPLFGGRLLVDLATSEITAMPVVGGGFTYNLPLPVMPGLVGQTIYCQSAALQPALPGLFEFSNGVMATICP